jgi:lysophospholipase L1-like esterase
MHQRLVPALVLLACLGLAGPAAPRTEPSPPAPRLLSPLPREAPFSAELNGFAEEDRTDAIKTCQILFVGSSSIRFWKTLEQDMAPYPVVNRGFGGSQASDVLTYFERLIPPRRPRAIVYYEGDNDIHAGKTPAQVFGDFQKFLAVKDRALGGVPVYFIAVKPSKARFSELAKQAEVNRDVASLVPHRRDLIFIDVVPAMLSHGKPKDIYVADGLHMTPAGYRIWTQIVKRSFARTEVMRRKCPA